MKRLSRAAQQMVADVISEWDASFQKTSAENNLTENNLTRMAYYKACLDILHDGPEMKLPGVKAALIKHYNHLYQESLSKIVFRQGAMDFMKAKKRDGL